MSNKDMVISLVCINKHHDLALPSLLQILVGGLGASSLMMVVVETSPAQGSVLARNDALETCIG